MIRRRVRRVAVGAAARTVGRVSSPLSPTELSLLLFTYQPRRPDPCRVCGAHLQVASAGRGSVAYVCSSPEADYLAIAAQENVSTWKHRGPLETAAAEHYDASRQVMTFHGDAGVVNALLELRALRTAAGEDMVVPVGAVHYPNGHGNHLCWRSLVHLGGDVWDERTDFEYSHDPAHATLERDDETGPGDS